jgi:hypothetical protein
LAGNISVHPASPYQGEKMKKLTLLFLVIVLAACSAAGTELSRNQTKWEQAGIEDYQFELTVGCFCPFGGQMPVTVEVRDGEVVSMTDANGEVVSPTDPMYENILQYATIDGLFSYLASDSVQEADKLTVTYDPTYGFPTEMDIDFIELAMDDELYLSVSGFEPLS